MKTKLAILAAIIGMIASADRLIDLNAKSDVATGETISAVSNRVEVIYNDLFDPASEELAAERGMTFLDAKDDEDENVAVAIGAGAKAGVTDEAITNAPSGTVRLRSAGVAIGPHAEVRNDTDPWKIQGVAIGWHAQATEINTLAIGAGAQHTNETAMTGDATVAGARQAIALGYGAKSTGIGAVQIGQGLNSTPNSLQFLDVPVVRDGRIAVDEKVVAQEAVEIMATNSYTTGEVIKTNLYTEARVNWRGPRDEDEFSLRLRQVKDETNPVALEWTLGNDQTVELYSAATIDAMTNAIWQAIRELQGE